MAQLPSNPKVGQAFLPNDELAIYVFNGYSCGKFEF